MKRILSGVLALLILLLAITGCSPNNKLLSEEDFNVYRDGKLFMDINDVKNKSIYLDPDSETFRGLKLNDTVTKVKELYGNETVYFVYGSDIPMEKLTVTDYIKKFPSGEFLIRFDKIYLDGGLYNLEQCIDFPVGTKYTFKTLYIKVSNYYVSEIKLDYAEATVSDKSS